MIMNMLTHTHMMSTPSIHMMIILHNQVHAHAGNNIFVPYALQSGVVQGFVRPNKNMINLCWLLVLNL